MPGRARLEVLALAVLFLVSASAAPAQATESRGAATQDGWWNRLQGPQEGEPEGNPVRPLFPALPKPLTVPADAISAGATAGQVDKVAGVGIDVVLADGATLDGLILRLKESDASGANVGADKAKVLACPATAPWGAGPERQLAGPPGRRLQPGLGRGRPGGRWHLDVRPGGHRPALVRPVRPHPGQRRRAGRRPGSVLVPGAGELAQLRNGRASRVELAATPPTGGFADGGAVATEPAVAAPEVAASGPSLENATGTPLPRRRPAMPVRRRFPSSPARRRCRPAPKSPPAEPRRSRPPTLALRRRGRPSRSGAPGGGLLGARPGAHRSASSRRPRSRRPGRA